MLRKIVLWPFEVLYACALLLRHWAYDSGILKSRQGVIPTFILGNLHAGGTGKTPHASYFLTLFSKKLGGEKHVALLSRGYKRNSKGFKVVEVDTTWRDVGDEPALLKSNHPLNPVYVCENRLKGIKAIKKNNPNVKLVILDDGLQHRRLTPHRSFLILDSNRPLKGTRLLPTGKLRDLKSRLSKFDAICISRSSGTLEEEMERQGLYNNDSQIFLSQMVNEGITPPSKKPRVLAVSGIAEPSRFMESLNKNWSVVRQESFPDHYEFTEKNVKSWIACIRNEKLSAIVTTTKDSVRIKPLLKDHKDIKLISIGIEVKWQNERELEAWVDQWLDSTIFATNK